MAAKSQNKSQLKITEEPGISKERQMANIALDPLAGAAAISNMFSKSLFGESDLSETYSALKERASAIRGGQLCSLEDTLTAQAAMLNAIFLELAQRSKANLGEYINAAERYMRLALKAQSQCRATLETLAAVKNPPVIYARQANIAAGHQQVNNGQGTSPRGKNLEVLPNELLESTGDEIERMDTGTAGAAVGGHSPLEPLEAIDRPHH